MLEDTRVGRLLDKVAIPASVQQDMVGLVLLYYIRSFTSQLLLGKRRKVERERERTFG